MAEREQSSRTTLSFSIDNILRDDFSRSSRVNRSFPFALASHTSHVHRESLACQECSSSARYIRPVYFYTAPSIASRTEVGTRVVRSHSNSQVQSTNSKNSGQEKSLANSIQTTAEAEPKKTTESSCKQDANLKTKNNPKDQPKDKKKRFRSHFSQLQLQYLESIFARQHYLSRDERTLLATALDMTELQVRNWFQNKRYQKRHREIQALEKVGKQVPVKIIVNGRSPVIPAFRIGHQGNPY